MSRAADAKRELPDGYAPYRQTKTYTQDTVPDALTSRHRTKTGVWALIRVESGELDLSIAESPPRRLTPARPGVVEPEVEHHVRPRGEVSFHIEFWRKVEPTGETP